YTSVSCRSSGVTWYDWEMIKAGIFDMDGLLIDSEPIWDKARDKVLGELGVKLTPNDVQHVRGQGVHNAVEYWHHQHPWKGKTQAETVDAIIDTFIELVKKKGELKPGVHKTISIFKEAGLPIAIASSSPMKVIDTVVDKLAIRELFDEIYSAREELHSK